MFLKKSISLEIKACENGNGQKCSDAGWMLETGSGVDKNLTIAKELYGKACDNEYANGCKYYVELNKKDMIPLLINRTFKFPSVSIFSNIIYISKYLSTLRLREYDK